ncbi:MAG: ribokinase [Clostridiales bacterium]|nr:MAG: ribokinase [Clostridiales bacterium]
MKVVVVGSINVDMTFYAQRFPVDGETVFGVKQKIGTGGKGLNQATAASRAGADVTFIGRVGDDFLSSVPLALMESEKMEISAVTKTENTATGCADIQVNTESGENRITVIRGANEALTAKDVYAAEKAFIECSCVLSQLEIPDEAILAAKELAKKYNKPFILNPAPMRDLPEGLFNEVDVLTPNETEAAYFSGLSVDEYEKSAEKLLAAGAKTVIITLGKKGSYLKNADISLTIPAIPQKAVDTTGAGDAYNGGLCAAIAEGKTLEDAVKFATATSSLSVTKAGAAESMPKREEIEKLLK